jgi:hypothetical protein
VPVSLLPAIATLRRERRDRSTEEEQVKGGRRSRRVLHYQQRQNQIRSSISYLSFLNPPHSIAAVVVIYGLALYCSITE